MFISYLKSCLNDKILDIRLGVLYNLPCFYFTYKSADDNI